MLLELRVTTFKVIAPVPNVTDQRQINKIFSKMQILYVLTLNSLANEEVFPALLG